MLSVVSVSDGMMISVTKWPFPNLRYYPDICLQSCREIKTWGKCPGQSFEWGIS